MKAVRDEKWLEMIEGSMCNKCKASNRIAKLFIAGLLPEMEPGGGGAGGGGGGGGGGEHRGSKRFASDTASTSEQQ
jgi:hypothetical protein